MGWIILLVWIACGFAASGMADRKNMGSGLWFILGLIFGPLAVLMVAVSSPSEADEKVLHLSDLPP